MPGASLTLSAETGDAFNRLGTSMPFDVYGDWCGVVNGTGQCFDMIRFT